MKKNVLIIGAGGVAQVVAHKCAQNSDLLGDIHIAEPGALIGFAGPRVIEQTIREKLPEGFQSSEYLMEHGMVDMVVSRLELKETIARLLKIMTRQPANDVSVPAPKEAEAAGKAA